MSSYRKKKKLDRIWSYDEPSLALKQIDYEEYMSLIRKGYPKQIAQSILIKKLVEKKSRQFEKYY